MDAQRFLLIALGDRTPEIPNPVAQQPSRSCRHGPSEPGTCQLDPRRPEIWPVPWAL